MGKLERQIMIGALALVGILVAVVILKGLAPRDDGIGENRSGLGSGTPLILEGGLPPDPGPLASEPPAQPEPWIDLGLLSQDADSSSLISLDGEFGGTPTPPAQETPPVVPANKGEYTIRKQDTLGHIAQRELGSARRAKEIMDLNPGLDEFNLLPGTVIKLPQGGAAPVKSEAVPAVVADAQFQVHTVVNGDSLWALADRYLSDGNRFREIVAANPGVLKSESSVLPLGVKLRIPKQ